MVKVAEAAREKGETKVTWLPDIEMPVPVRVMMKARALERETRGVKLMLSTRELSIDPKDRDSSKGGDVNAG